LDSLWIEAFRYHRWANLHLLDVCGGLTDEQLQLTSPGTYGTIAATLFHLIGAEQGYIERLGGTKRRFTRDMEFPGIDALKKEAERCGDELIGLASHTEPDDEFEAVFQDGRYRLQKGVVLIQALHHGNDHRTHVCTILGAHGIDYGDMDVWAYGDATGSIVPLGAA
jgi:uncharacterized damage-inducible protein DinB